MKFKFNLEKVLKHRHILVDLARKDFLEAQANVDAAKKILDDMIDLKNQQKLVRSQKVQSGKDWQNDVEQINKFLQGQDLRIARQNESLNKLEKEVESYREILLKALTEAKMIEKLKERKKQQFVKEFNETEAKELDEIATLRFSRIEKE